MGEHVAFGEFLQDARAAQAKVEIRALRKSPSLKNVQDNTPRRSVLTMSLLVCTLRKVEKIRLP